MTDNVNDSGVRLTAAFPVVRYNRGSLENKDIELAREVPYTLFVNDREILSIATLPTGLMELFAGFLVSEGVLTDPGEILEFQVDHGSRLVRVELEVARERLEKLERKGMLTSGCAGGLVFSTQAENAPRKSRPDPLKVACSTILDRMRELDTYRGIYSITRGVHAASVADASATLLILEDLGRHNAVDKIVGHCFLSRIDTSDKLLLTTGRITSEVLTKAARSGFSLIVSRSSASALAVVMAEQSGIDVVTYVRAQRFNYFSHGACRLTED
ncbi:MAG: formate dehydrogenase accessory sulfurtransferase FdhD [Desulfomonilaceae bacterium]|nr:formate dehydrogenase accessory sulfurtransferase FdhD [Desulfomonilaceae bacterium]